MTSDEIEHLKWERDKWKERALRAGRREAGHDRRAYPFTERQWAEARRTQRVLVRLQVDARPALGRDATVIEYVGLGDLPVIEWVRQLAHVIGAYSASHQANGSRRRRV